MEDTMPDLVRPGSPSWVRPKTFVFAAIAAMGLYVLYHNERFLIDPSHPVWQHYEPFKWWLLPHGVAGACALFLAPLQFSDRLRRSHLNVHKTIGFIYVISALIFAPIGTYIQYLDEAQGAARTFTIETFVQAGLMMITTVIGMACALKGLITQHRQWMIRSYAVALTFLEIRVILGITGWDNPMEWGRLETVVWVCVALSIFVGDVANHIYERRTARPRVAQTAAAPTGAVSAARAST
jgi:hypothetical protein